MAFRFQHSQEWALPAGLDLWNSRQVFVIARCCDWRHRLVLSLYIATSTKWRFDFSIPKNEPFQLALTFDGLLQVFVIASCEYWRHCRALSLSCVTSTNWRFDVSTSPSSWPWPLELSPSLCYCPLLWLKASSGSFVIYCDFHKMAFRFQHSQEWALPAGLDLWNSRQVFVIARCCDWRHRLVLSLYIATSTKWRFDFSIPKNEPFQLALTFGTLAKSLLLPAVVIEGIVWFFRYILRLPQIGVSIFLIFPYRLIEHYPLLFLIISPYFFVLLFFFSDIFCFSDFFSIPSDYFSHIYPHINQPTW